ncbi:DLW-39 family protein [Nocardioides mangrovicus]|nr:DLW-39 family protein [Nocardioides mangrovicus]
MKKLLLLAAAIGAGLVVKKKLDENKADQTLWHEATDPVHKA